MRAAVETSSPFDRSTAKRLIRATIAKTAQRFGYRVEKLPDLGRMMDDGSSTMPDLHAKAVGIPGMINLRRGTSMYYMALGTAAIEDDIIEIGSWQGRSTVFLAQACADAGVGVVHAIDTFKGNPGHEKNYAVGADRLSKLEQNFRANIAAAGLSDRVRVHAKASADAIGDVRTTTAGARLIYIDGEHTYEAVRSDLANYADLLRPGGLLLFDDYSRGFPVVKAVEEHIAAHPGRYARRVQDDNLLVLRRIS